MRHLPRPATPSMMVTIVIAALVLGACQPGAASTPTPTPIPIPTLAFTSPAPTLAPATATPTPPPRTAALSELQNEVKASTSADAEWEDASEGQLIQTGGGVRTGDESRARLDISDDTIIRMAANSEFELMELRGESADAVTRLKLAAGKLWMSVTVALGAVFEIETPAGTATVRGSYMSAEYDEATGRMVVTCLEGQCQLIGVSGQFTDLTNGQQAEIPSVGADPSPAQPMTGAQYADWAENFPEAPVPTATPTETPSPSEIPTSTPSPTRTSTPRPLFTPTETQPPTQTRLPGVVIMNVKGIAIGDLPCTLGGENIAPTGPIYYAHVGDGGWAENPLGIVQFVVFMNGQSLPPAGDPQIASDGRSWDMGQDFIAGALPPGTYAFTWSIIHTRAILSFDENGNVVPSDGPRTTGPIQGCTWVIQ